MTPTKFDLLQWMTPDLQEEFLARLYPRHYQTGQFLYVQGSVGTEMFRLISGTVKISVLRANGRHITYRLFESGDCFGQTSLVDGEPRPQSTEASSPIKVGVLLQSDYRSLSKLFPAFDRAIMRLLSAQLRVVAQNYEGASLDRLTVRVAKQLLHSFTVELQNFEQSEMRPRRIRFSQSELAAMVGASRQSVNQVLQQFQQQGSIEIGYGCINIVNLSALKLASTQ